MPDRSFSTDFPPLMLGDFLAAADLVIPWLKRLAHYGPGNRFEVYRKLLDHAANAPQDQWLTPATHEALQAFAELFLAVKAFGTSPPIPLEKLDVLTSGRVGASHDPHSDPWDVQFEIFVATLMRLSGLAEVTFAEPDLIVPAGDQRISFAVKRVTSPRSSSAMKRFKEAAGQIDRWAQPGVIVIARRPLDSAPSQASEADFYSFADLLRRRVDSGVHDLTAGCMLFQFGFYPTRSDDGHLSANTDVKLDIHLSRIPEDTKGSTLAWLTDRGSQLTSTVRRELHILRRSWWDLTTA